MPIIPEMASSLTANVPPVDNEPQESRETISSESVTPIESVWATYGDDAKSRSPVAAERLQSSTPADLVDRAQIDSSMAQQMSPALDVPEVLEDGTADDLIPAATLNDELVALIACDTTTSGSSGRAA